MCHKDLLNFLNSKLNPQPLEPSSIHGKASVGYLSVNFERCCLSPFKSFWIVHYRMVRLVCLVLLLAELAFEAHGFLSREIVKVSADAADFSLLAYSGSSSDILATYNDKNDRSIVAFRGGHCFGAYRGTTKKVSDWAQNFDLTDKILTVGSSKCRMRSGFFDGHNTHYLSSFTSELEKCMNTRCATPQLPHKKCPLVLTGHSQGGAIAVVASLIYRRYDPLVITFGAPRAVDAPCSLINAARHYRYINTGEKTLFARKGLAFDLVPMTPGTGSDHFGHAILLGQDTDSVAMLGINNDNNLLPAGPTSVHSVTSYQHKLRSMSNLGVPIKTTGFSMNRRCTKDNQCQTRMCKHVIGFFNTVIDNGKYCTGLTGGKCNEDSDCRNRRCVKDKCRAGNLNDVCGKDSDCNSGRCDSNCKNKLSRGSSCNENSDCQSNNCKYKFPISFKCT